MKLMEFRIILKFNIVMNNKKHVISSINELHTY